MGKTASQSGFDFAISSVGDVGVLHCLNTHYHSDSFAALSEKLQEIDAATPSGRIIIDLKGVRLLSSTALRAFRAAHLSLEERGGGVVVAGGEELVRRVLKFAPFLSHHLSVKDAAEALGTAAD